jgi:hypothetical protein
VQRGLISVRRARAVHAEQFLATRVRGEEQAQQRQVGMRAAVEIGGGHAAAVQRQDERPRRHLRLGQQAGQLDGAAPQHDLSGLDGSSTWTQILGVIS